MESEEGYRCWVVMCDAGMIRPGLRIWQSHYEARLFGPAEVVQRCRELNVDCDAIIHFPALADEHYPG